MNAPYKAEGVFMISEQIMKIAEELSRSCGKKNLKEKANQKRGNTMKMDILRKKANLTAKISLFTVSVLIMCSGCMTGSDNKELDDIRSALAKQNAELATIRADLNKLMAKTSEEAAESQRDKLVDAALFLINNGPLNSSSQAIQLLGYIGGKKAEDVLVDIAENGSENRYNYALNALNTMHSKKLRNIIIKELSGSNPSHQRMNAVINVLRNNSENILEKDDLPLLEKALAKLNNPNNSYIYETLIGLICRFDQDKGVELACEALLLLPRERRTNIIYPLADRNSLSVASWKKIIKAAGPPETNVRLYQSILERMANSGDWRITDIILPWNELACSNTDFRRSYMNALGRLQDPKAAKIFLDLCNKYKSENGNNRNYCLSYLRNYPGIEKSGNDYVLADGKTMEKLMEQRARRIEYLNEKDEALKRKKSISSGNSAVPQRKK